LVGREALVVPILPFIGATTERGPPRFGNGNGPMESQRKLSTNHLKGCGGRWDRPHAAVVAGPSIRSTSTANGAPDWL